MDVATGRTRLLHLGALTLARDWGWAAQYVDAMVRMLDRDTPAEAMTLKWFAQLGLVSLQAHHIALQVAGNRRVR
jgi:GDP-D-mannose dehydratase